MAYNNLTVYHTYQGEGNAVYYRYDYDFCIPYTSSTSSSTSGNTRTLYWNLSIPWNIQVDPEVFIEYMNQDESALHATLRDKLFDPIGGSTTTSYSDITGSVSVSESERRFAVSYSLSTSTKITGHVYDIFLWGEVYNVDYSEDFDKKYYQDIVLMDDEKFNIKSDTTLDSLILEEFDSTFHTPNLGVSYRFSFSAEEVFMYVYNNYHFPVQLSFKDIRIFNDEQTEITSNLRNYVIYDTIIPANTYNKRILYASDPSVYNIQDVSMTLSISDGKRFLSRYISKSLN